MKRSIPVLIALTNLVLNPGYAAPLSTAFTYQGRLTDNGQLANGGYDLTFQLFDAETDGLPVGVTVTNITVPVANGLFTTSLDFGAGVFDGSVRWLEISAKTNGAAAFTLLSPRQALTPSPYAIFAPNAAIANGVAAGSVAAPQLNTPGAPATGQLLSYNGTSLVWTNASTVGTAWNLSGNGGTTPGTQFMGTTDNQPVEIKVNGQRALRLEPDPTGRGAPNVIGGSPQNYVSPGVFGATIGGGGTLNYLGSTFITNVVSAHFGTIAGGGKNTSGGIFSSISGGVDNTCSGDYATVGGGGSNLSTGRGATIGGGENNRATGVAATVAGGFGNTSSSGDATVGGGTGNNSSANGATVGGGSYNRSIGMSATIGGGDSNKATGSLTVVAGGENNTAGSNDLATVSGGVGNISSGYAATVSGGQGNAASGDSSAIPGGLRNSATGVYSLAAGHRAKANHDGTFVWADSADFDFASAATNEFAVRATGGARFVSSLDSNGVAVAGVLLPAGSGSWSTLSDRNAKTHFAPVSPRELLDRLAQLPIGTWNYKSQSESVRHIGPTAQDFYAAFDVGEDDKHIATVDADGVALAAIQGLNQKLTEELRRRDAELRAVRQQLDELKTALGKQTTPAKGGSQ